MSAVLDAIIARAEAGKSTARDGYIILELMQQEVDRLRELIDDLLPYSEAVTVKINGNNIRFENIDKVAEWLTGGRA